MNAELIREYRKARAPYVSAVSAYRLAQWRIGAELMESGHEWESEGFTLRVSVDVDDMPFDSDDVPEFLDEPNADTVHNPAYRGDSRRPGNDKPYALVPLMRLTEMVAWYRKNGATRSVARDIATRVITDHVRDWTWDYGRTPYVITVTASLAGVELGSASLCGVDLGDDWSDGARYVAETAHELESEAIESARVTRAAICGGIAS